MYLILRLCFCDARLLCWNKTWSYILDIINATLSRLFLVLMVDRGTRWLSWLRYCVRSRKFADSIPEGVIGNFHWHSPYGRRMAIGSTQPLTELSTRSISWGKGGRCLEPIVFKSGSHNLLEPSGPSRPVMGLHYLLPLLIVEGKDHPMSCLGRSSGEREGQCQSLATRR
jgi:hypothetical protein